ncbi:MAG TPA: phosphatidate cytidylyltransferase [Candidatus Lokiarchaeia archaeon]|nr:phosphatidate cytidylyltransferase [Candidatus Lokiarchaeia archaeon]
MDVLPLMLSGSAIFVFFAICTFVYAKKTRYQPDKDGKFFPNEVLISVLYIIAAVMYPFFYINLGISSDTQYMMYLSTLVIWVAEIGIFGFYILRERHICKGNPQLLADRDYVKIKADYRANYHYDVKKDFKRKMLHLLAVVVIVAAWEMGRIMDSLDFQLFGMNAMAFYKWMSISVGLAFVIMFGIGDFVRLNYYAYLPPWAIKWFTSSLKEDELVTYIASAPLVLGFVPFIFAPFQMFLSVALITSLADAAASLVGKQFGKHHLSPTNKKTFEGLFAGGFAAFIIVALAMGTYPAAAVTSVIAMAAIAASLFMTVDLTVKNYSDNIMNSLVCGAGMVLFLLFLV